MITNATCDRSYMEQAFKHVAAFVGDLKDKAGALGARYGVIATGNDAGNIALFQNYEDLNGIDRAFKVYADSPDYQAVITSGKVQVQFRNLWKVETLNQQNQSADAPAYGVVTRFASADLMLDRVQKFVPLFEENGAMTMRYGTLMTGNNAGKRLLGVTYPSMAAIEKTYDALQASDDYGAMLADVDLDLRNIIKFVG
jgi:hypothetical protein